METKENLVEASELDIRTNEGAAAVAEAQSESANKAEAKEEVGTHQEHIREALELLYKLFPKAFIREGNCKPLKIGILDDLKERAGSIEGLSISKVRAAVRVYTTRLRYFYAVREGAMRVDLDGNEVEAVTAEHAEYARTRFTEINAGRQPNRNANKKPGRPFNRNARHNNGDAADGNNGERHSRFNNNRRPNNGNTQNRGSRFNNQNRRFEPAKESDIKVGRYVFISADHSYRKATIVEDLHGDTVKLDLQSGMSVTMPLSRLFVSVSTGRPHRPFDRTNNRGPRRDDHRRNDFSKGKPHTGSADRASKEKSAE